MKFIHAVVFGKDEFEQSNYNTQYWGDLTDGDYVVHCLYNVDNEQIIILEDNCHMPVEDMIESFIEGVEYAGAEAYVDKAFIVIDSGEDCYFEEDVEAYLKNGNFTRV
jgi:hypothetical protein